MKGSRALLDSSSSSSGKSLHWSKTNMEEAKKEGGAAWQAGDMPKAIECFSKAIELGEASNDPELYKVYSNRSAAYIKSGNSAAALTDSDKCIALKPSWPKGYGRKGLALLKLGRTADAAAAYSSGLALDPSNADLRAGLADANKQRSASSPSGIATKAKSFVSKNKNLAAQFMLRSFALINFLIFLLPVAGMSTAGYRRALGAYLINIIVALYGKHGVPKKSMAYLQSIVMDPSSHQIFTGLLLWMQRPYLVGAFPIVLVMAMNWMWFFSCLLQVTKPTMLGKIDAAIGPRLASFSSMPTSWTSTPLNKRWEFVVGKGEEVAARVEVSFGFLLLVELLLPRRNLIMFFLYWQVMRMRVMLESIQGQPGRLQLAFANVDRQITGILMHPRCPQTLLTIYNRAKGLLASMTKLPEPPAEGQASSPSLMPKCTIM